jgi:hypothetical protein
MSIYPHILSSHSVTFILSRSTLFPVNTYIIDILIIVSTLPSWGVQTHKLPLNAIFSPRSTRHTQEFMLQQVLGIAGQESLAVFSSESVCPKNLAVPADCHAESNRGVWRGSCITTKGFSAPNGAPTPRRGVEFRTLKLHGATAGSQMQMPRVNSRSPQSRVSWLERCYWMFIIGFDSWLSMCIHDVLGELLGNASEDTQHYRDMLKMFPGMEHFGASYMYIYYINICIIIFIYIYILIYIYLNIIYIYIYNYI